MEEKTHGLLLQSIAYLGQKKILKVLTPDHGLVTLISKSPFTPFLIAEWVYRKTQKEIHPLKDSTLLDPLLPLRQSYEVLTAAGAIAQNLLQTQLPNKKATDLYALACLYLKHLPQNPQTLLASFRMKLLLHEGLLSPEPDPAFTPSEWQQVITLAFARRLSHLQNLIPPHDKIEALFNFRTN